MEPPEFKGWLEHGWGIEVRTAHQLFDIISHIALLEEGRIYAWRGQRNAAWAFNASLYRRLRDDGGQVTEQRIREREKEILDKARRWGLGRDLGPSATDLHLLALLQHHGVPTSLIDVTANPMTALWFATDENELNKQGDSSSSPGVLFAIDVTETPWHETFSYIRPTYGDLSDPLGALYQKALKESAEANKKFRIYPALPDERMKAQEGYLLGCAVPEKHEAAGVLGCNPGGPAPGEAKLKRLLASEKGKGRPFALPFCAIVIPDLVKRKVRGPLKRTYNRRRRVLFPDVDGFRDNFDRIKWTS